MRATTAETYVSPNCKGRYRRRLFRNWSSRPLSLAGECNPEATAAWVEAQNQVTNAYLAKIPFRNALLNRLTDLANYEKIGAPFKKHGKYYFYKNDGLQNQSVLYVQDSLESEPRVFLDPNKLSDDGTVALTGISFSHDGKYTAYTISRSGSDWTEIYVMDRASVNAGRPYPVG